MLLCTNIVVLLSCSIVALFVGAQAISEGIPKGDVASKSLTSLDLELRTLREKLNQLRRLISRDETLSEFCTVEINRGVLRFNQSETKSGYIQTQGGSWIKVKNERGLTIAELDLLTCKMINRQQFSFDTNAETEASQFEEYFESALTGTVIVGLTVDSLNLTEEEDDVTEIFSSYNMDLSGILTTTGETFGFILQKGYPKKTVYQKKNGLQENVKIRVKLSGTSASDVTFNRFL